MADPHRSFEAVTPLVSSRTLQSAATTALAHTVGASSRPLRSSDAAGQNFVPMTASRLPLLRRKPSETGLAQNESTGNGVRRASTSEPKGSVIPIPSSVSRIGTLKRSSSIAGLQQDFLARDKSTDYLCLLKCDTESELSSTKRQLTRALHQVDELKHELEKRALEAESAQSGFEAQLKEVTARADRLERHRAILMAKETETEEEMSKERESHAQIRADLQATVRTLREELNLSKNQEIESGEKLRANEFRLTQLSAENGHLKDAVTSMETELDAIASEADEAQQELTKQIQSNRELEAELAAVKSKAQVSESDGSNEIIKQELHRQVVHLKSLEKENSKLSRRLETFERQHSNYELLKETNLSLETKLRHLEPIKTKAAELEAQLVLLQREKQDWAVFLDSNENVSNAEFSSPRKVTKSLAALKIENETLKEKTEAHKFELNQRNKLIGELEKELKKLCGEFEQTKKKLHETEMKAKQIESRENLLTQEISMLKLHLQSYSTEEAVQQKGNFDTQKTARIEELEELLAAHKIELANTTNQVNHFRGLVERYGGSTTEIIELEKDEKPATATSQTLQQQLKLNQELGEELDELKKENLLLVTEIESLENELQTVSDARGIKGSFNPETHKVLEFAESPDRVEHAIRTKTLSLLRAENENLLDRISAIEQRKSDSKPGAQQQQLVPRESLLRLEDEFEQVSYKLKQKEILVKRISSALGQKVEEMRIAISKLLGFQLAFLDSGRIRVTSVYAPSKERSLAFDPWKQGPMPYKLVTAPDELALKSKQVQNDVEFWLETRKSLPGFLAALTITLHEEASG